MTRPVPVLPFSDEEIVLHGHLFIHHSVYMGSTWDLGELTAAHTEEHDPAWTHLLTHPHTHSAPAAESEWSWDE